MTCHILRPAKPTPLHCTTENEIMNMLIKDNYIPINDLVPVNMERVKGQKGKMAALNSPESNHV